MPDAIILGIVVACAFAVGLAVNSGSTCAVAAARDLIHDRQIDSTVGFLLAIGVAGLLTISARWLFGPVIHLVGDPPISVPLLLGSMLLGVGASLNGACAFGTLGRIGNGELRFLGMPLGLAIGFAMVRQTPLMAMPALQLSAFAAPSVAGGLLLLLLALLAWTAWRHLGPSAAAAQPGYRRAMLVLGFAGAAGFMLLPGSSYGDAVRLSVQGAMMGYAVPMATTVAALAGTLISGAMAGRLQLSWPRLGEFLRSVGGGALMAAGGSLIPGGNDALLLAYLPAATLGGLVAYLVMTGTVAALQIAPSLTSRWGKNGGRSKD